MRCSPQRSHMHVEFVSQDLKGYPIMRRPLRLQRPGLADDSLWREPSARIPGAECFEGDAQSRRAFRLGEAKSRADFPQGRGVLGHRSQRCHWSVATESE